MEFTLWHWHQHSPPPRPAAGADAAPKAGSDTLDNPLLDAREDDGVALNVKAGVLWPAAGLAPKADGVCPVAGVAAPKDTAPSPNTGPDGIKHLVMHWAFPRADRMMTRSYSKHYCE